MRKFIGILIIVADIIFTFLMYYTSKKIYQIYYQIHLIYCQ